MKISLRELPIRWHMRYGYGLLSLGHHWGATGLATNKALNN
jgi:hypothetical protein